MTKYLAFLAAVFFALSPLSVHAEVTVDGLSYSVKAVKVASVIDLGFDSERASGEYILVKLLVRNVGNKPADISGDDFHLQRGKIQYDAASASMDMEEHFFLTKLNPGTARAAWIVFDVPAHTSPSKYELQVYGNGSDKFKLIQL